MDARLPSNPNLGFYRRLAKDLKHALVADDPKAKARLAQHHPRFRGRSVSLGDAQLVIAREHGYSAGSELRRAVESAATTPGASPIDELISAIPVGDLDRVRRSLAVDRPLARQSDSKGTLPLVEACDRGALAIV